MHRFLARVTTGALASVLTVTAGAAAQPALVDERAVAVADEVMVALGGRKAWDDNRFIGFTFVRGETVLKLTWDKWSGRYRLDATMVDGRPYVVLMNVNTKEGEVYLAGERLQGDQRDEYLDRGYGVWKGETYWLLAPYKMRDPGVTLRHETEDTIDGITYDVVHLSFEDIDPSGNEFWLYVNPETHLVDRWRFLLGDRAEGEFLWKGWEEYNGLMMSTIREAMGGTVAIRMTDIVITDDMPDIVFSSPGPVPAP